jgi:hypothetical protein
VQEPEIIIELFIFIIAKILVMLGEALQAAISAP